MSETIRGLNDLGRVERHEIVEWALRRHRSHGWIAARYNISRQTVSAVLKAAREDRGSVLISPPVTIKRFSWEAEGAGA